MGSLSSRLSKLVCFISVGAVALGCARREVSKVEPETAAVSKSEIAVEPNRDIDILFVIDNSQSMRQEQISLVDNFPLFIQELEKIEGGLPNVHIGVISTDLGAGIEGEDFCDPITGDAGQLQNEARPLPRGELDSCGDPNPNPIDCAGSVPEDKFIEDILLENLERKTNYPGTLTEVFECIAPLGRCGCGFEQPLEAMRKALDPNNGFNDGFLRESAFLAVIIISDEDDCSMANTQMIDRNINPFNGNNQASGSFLCFENGVICDPDDPRPPGEKLKCKSRPGINSGDPDASEYMFGVEEYVTFLKGLKKDPGLLIVAEVTGGDSKVEVLQQDVALPPPSETVIINRTLLAKECEEPNIGAADPAIRLLDFARSFPKQNTTTTICPEDGDLSGALAQIGELVRDVVNNPCVQGNIDTDPNKDDVQFECVVSDVLNSGFDDETSTVLAQCASATPEASELPCWHLREEPTCNTTTNLELVDERPAEGAPVGTRMRLECVVVN